MAMPSVAEVFKGSIDESLKKLVQPAGVVPATVLVFANLVFIYPSLLGAEIAAATAFDDLDDAWKGVVLTGLILVVGYVILNLSASAMRLATGELVAGSTLGDWLKDIQANHIRKDEAQANKDRKIKSDLSRLPLPEDAAPTWLGNVFAGSNTSLYKRYGFDIAAMWAHLEAIGASIRRIRLDRNAPLALPQG